MDPRQLDLQSQSLSEHQDGDSTDVPPPPSHADWNDFDNFFIHGLDHVNFQSGPSCQDVLGLDSSGDAITDHQSATFQEQMDTSSADCVAFYSSQLDHDTLPATESTIWPVENLHDEQWPLDPAVSCVGDLPQKFTTGHETSQSPYLTLQALETTTVGSSRYSVIQNSVSSPVTRAHCPLIQGVGTSQGLPRRRSRYQLRRSAAAPIFIPNSINAPDPIQRWQESPPEDEPASMSAIANALKTQQNQGLRKMRSSSGSGANSPQQDAFHGYRRPKSTASSISGTSASSHHSVSSSRSATSTCTRNGIGPSKSHHGRVRKAHRDNTKKSADDTRRIFCCTFCCDRFKTKYDWVRHEGSLHLNLRSWVCTPHGGSVTSPLTGRQHCAYCNALDPTDAHLDQHNHRACSDKPRSFGRKDHLVQHLRLTHNIDTIPHIDDWKIDNTAITSRCGFCDHRMESWDERTKHLAGHFRRGATMDDWKGDHEFPSSVAAKVTNNVAPYLIKSESRTMVPFSATSSTVKDHFAQISSRADHVRPKEDCHQDGPLASSFQQLHTSDVPLSSFAEVLTSHLSRFARAQMEQGIVPTDEMFQQESRRVLYDSEDSWNQTVADNTEWLSDFRRQHLNKPQDAQPYAEDD